MYKVLYNLPESEYHSLAAIGSSTIKQMAVSPKYFMECIARQGETNPAFAIGSMFHEAILEPEKDPSFIAAPEVDRRTKEGKAAYAEFQENCNGKEVIKKEDFENCKAMIATFKDTGAYDRTFKGGAKTEVSIIGPDKKCRFDLLKEKPTGFIAYDLKTTADIPRDASAWQRFFIKSGYHIQSAWYQDVAKEAGINILAFHFAVISKKYPYEHAVVTLDDEFLEYGREQANRSYELLKECQKTGIWPGVFEMSGAGSQVIEKPRWLK